MSLSEPPGTALISGASTGIGATYADRLAQRGYRLILVARNASRLHTLAERLRQAHGAQVDVMTADLTSPPQRASVEQRLRDDSDITLLVNNAGMSAGRPIATAPADDVEAMIQLNIIAPTRLAGAALPGMLARGRGGIISIASALALVPELFGGSYPATKSYILSYTLALNKEVSERGIRVQAVLPGVTRTDIWERSGLDVNAIPAHMVMEVEEMVDAALAGFDLGEVVTIPSLPDIEDWNRFDAMRRQLGPALSRDHAADRYKSDLSEDA